MDYQKRYQYWVENAKDTLVAADLKGMDDHEQRERFSFDLEFGTGGLRGKLGAGSARMNIYTVRKATQGFADYLKSCGGESIAISFDSRHLSQEFALESALVMAANGIKAHLYPRLMPTPALSFAVRKLHCDGGIMITASHNPGIYNGYKAYGADGCQITLEAANAIEGCIGQVDEFKDVLHMDEAKARAQGLLVTIPDSVEDAFLDAVLRQSVYGAKGLRVVYSPLYGTGNLPVRAVLGRIGVDVHVVSSQELPDGDFPTASFPNPEEREAMAETLKLSAKVKPDLALATDPDCDRVGIAVPDENGDYQLMTGNEVGVLLMDFLLRIKTEQSTLPKNPLIIKTIVSTPLAYPVAQAYGAEVMDVLTGFKFIGEQIGLLEARHEEDRFILGFEESYGYLAGTHARDKDAVVASMLICECAAYHKAQGRTLLMAMEHIYMQYGYQLNSLMNITSEGLDGMARIQRLMAFFREFRGTIFGKRILVFSDYETGRITDLASGDTKPTNLPHSDVLRFALEDGCEVICRPSGTEPKIKFYITASGETRERATVLGAAIRKDVQKLIDSVQ